MAFIADHLFPPLTLRDDENDCTGDEYSSFNFWRDPVAEIPLEGDELILDNATATVASKSSDKAFGTQLTTIPEK